MTLIVGSCVALDGSSGAGAGPGIAGVLAGGVGVVTAGVPFAGAVGCGGGVCAKAPAQTDVIKRDVDASNRARSAMTAPIRGGDEPR